MSGRRSTRSSTPAATCSTPASSRRPRAGGAVVQGGRRVRRQLRLPVPVRRVPHLLRQRAHRQGPVGRRRAGADRRAADHRRRLPRPARQGPDPTGRAADPPGPAGGRRPAAAARLGEGVDAEAEECSRWRRCCSPEGTHRRPAAAWSTRLDQLAGHRSLLAGALDLLVDASWRPGDVDGARATARGDLASSRPSRQHRTAARRSPASARGAVARWPQGTTMPRR